METHYSVSHNGKPCGKVTVTKCGLYYQFLCRCMIDRDHIYRLTLLYEGKQKNLGILVPTEESFGLSTRLPVKQLQEGEWSFQIHPKEMIQSVCFVPIRPEEPFSYISRLKESFLVDQNEEPGIRIQKMQE